MNRLRVAVIGAGRLGGFHAQKLAQLPEVELVGVADPVESQRSRVAAECRTAAFADYRELCGRIDAAVVAVPTRLHHALGDEQHRYHQRERDQHVERAPGQIHPEAAQRVLLPEYKSPDQRVHHRDARRR